MPITYILKRLLVVQADDIGTFPFCCRRLAAAAVTAPITTTTTSPALTFAAGLKRLPNVLREIPRLWAGPATPEVE